MDGVNTIILLKGELMLPKREYKCFEKGSTIWGVDRQPEEIKRWNIEQEQEAKAELAKLRCEYIKRPEMYDITEYALEYCECDEDGELVSGSNFDLAEEE